MAKNTVLLSASCAVTSVQNLHSSKWKVFAPKLQRSSFFFFPPSFMDIFNYITTIPWAVESKETKIVFFSSCFHSLAKGVFAISSQVKHISIMMRSLCGCLWEQLSEPPIQIAPLQNGDKSPTNTPVVINHLISTGRWGVWTLKRVVRLWLRMLGKMKVE